MGTSTIIDISFCNVINAMAKAKPIEIEILKAGTHRSSDGRECKFSVNDLAEIANSYSPERFKAPIIVSHNTSGLPDKSIIDSELAHGFPQSLKVVGDRLVALCEKVSPNFKNWFKNNQLLSFSSSLYLRDSPSNPTPGQLALRHIAALGATPPAIKGLKPLTLSEINFAAMQQDEGIADFSCLQCIGGTMEPIAALLRGMRDFLIESRDLTTADQILPTEMIDQISAVQNDQLLQMIANQVNALTERVIALETEETTEPPNTGSMDTPDETPGNIPSEYAEQMTALQLQLQAEKDRVATLLRQAKRSQIESFAELMKNEGRLLPAQLEIKEINFNEAKQSLNIIDFMAGLSDEQLVFFQQWLRGTPKQINYSELTADTSPLFVREAPKSTVLFDPKSQEIDQKIRAFQEANPTISYIEAARRLGVK